MQKNRENLDRLDQLGRQWGDLELEGNEARKQALEMEIFGLIFEIWDGNKERDALGRFFEKDWSRQGFQASQSTLSDFVKNRMIYRVKDEKAEGAAGTRKVVNPNTGKQERVLYHHDSLDTPVGGEGDGDSVTTVGDLTPDQRCETAQQELELDAWTVQLLTIMLQLPQRLQARARNPVRENYYRLFFTDGFANFIQKERSLENRDFHERDVFAVMKLPFLDYFLTARCRTLAELTDCPSKLYGQLVEGRPMEDCKRPFPSDVYSTYLKQVEDYKASASAISQQWTSYQDFLAKELGVRR